MVCIGVSDTLLRAVEKPPISLRLPDFPMRVPYDCHCKEFLVKVVNFYKEALDGARRSHICDSNR